MENPTQVVENPYESQEARVELLETLIEHYDQNIEPKLREYLMVSNIIYKEEGLYNDDLQRSKLLTLNAELSKVKGTMSKLLAEHESFIQSIGIIFQQLPQRQTRQKTPHALSTQLTGNRRNYCLSTTWR